MLYSSLNLSGAWEMDYQKDEYVGKENPFKHNGTLIENAIPSYWEDMADIFTEAHFAAELQINPAYAPQSYPISGDIPDMLLPNYVGNFFYKRNFVCDKTSAPTVVSFEHVQNRVSVWINDIFIGKHEGYSTPFEFTVPADVLVDGENTIVLSVSNHTLHGFDDLEVSGLTSRAAKEYTGGVGGNVELRFYESALRDVYVTVTEDLARATAHVELAEKAEFDWAVYDGDAVILSGKACGDFDFDASKLSPWSPESPKRYKLLLTQDGATLEHSFGIKRLIAVGTKLSFNGQPYYLRGICEHCYYAETVHPSRDIAFYHNVITKLKQLGFNFIRFHTYVPPKEYLEAADELGMLIHIESPNYVSLDEWKQIVRFARHYTSVAVYCCGNELLMDEPFIEHLNKCSDAVHEMTDSLFSPLSALRGLEYYFHEPELEFEIVDGPAPIRYNPRRFELVKKFTDVFNSYTRERNSYYSHLSDPELVDAWSFIYEKPRISHEICIDGTYTDLSLKDRYKGTRIGKTAMFSSIEEHLKSKGLLEKAPLYFKNSCEWQRRMRKYCFEKARMSRELAGYDFLGPIDTHWHTFGYDVGMMNEFYELKPGETVENVLRYNSETVLLTESTLRVSYYAGDDVSIGLHISHFGEDIKTGVIEVSLTDNEGQTAFARNFDVADIMRGDVKKLFDIIFKLPEYSMPKQLTLGAKLVSGGKVVAQNEWELYAFPRVSASVPADVVLYNGTDGEELKNLLREGKKVLAIGDVPFQKNKTSIRIALAGRNEGDLATVINSHAAIEGLAHEGFCSWQFTDMLEGGSSVIFEDGVPFDPIIEVVSTHKYAIRQASLFEFNALGGKLMVCSLNLSVDEPASRWLLANLIAYVGSDKFDPKNTIDEEQLNILMYKDVVKAAKNTNLAFNANDKAANARKKK